MNNGYVFKILIATDMLGCVIIWRDADVTISSMTGLALRRLDPPRWARVLGGVLNWLSKNHCESAITNDIARAKAAIGVLL